MAMSWHINKTVLETNEYMLNNEIMCDVTFLMGKNKTPVRCHTYMLVSRSPVFFAMFSGEWSTTNQIEIPDIEPEIMKLLLRYVYTEKCPLTGNGIMSLLYGAKKYNIQDLEKECASYLEDNICAETACVILEQARMYSEEDLSLKCKAYILANASDSLKSDGFNTIHKDTLAEIIGSDDLVVDNELEVYGACKRWATARCEILHKESSPENIREALGEILFMIRFPLLTTEAFAEHVSLDNILTSDEKVQIFRYIAMKGDIVSFNVNARCKTYVKATVKQLSRFGRGMKNWSHNNQEDAISFYVSKRSHLAGVSLYSPTSSKLPGTVSGEFKVLEDNKTVFSKNVTLAYSRLIAEDIIFTKPLLLQPGNIYTLSQKFQGSRTCGGECGKESVKVDDVTVTFTGSERDQKGTSVNRGQFPILLLC